MIVTEDDAWYCYSHKTGGGIFEWVAVEEGICSCRNLPLTDDQFKEALNVAADRAGVDLSGGADYEDLSDEQRALHALATDILHGNLNAVVEGVTIRHKVKEQRGFTDEMVDEAKVGYLDDQSHAELLEE
jgi:DNA primase